MSKTTQVRSRANKTRSLAKKHDSKLIKSKKLTAGWRAKLHDKRYLGGLAAILLFAAAGSYFLIISKAAASNGTSFTPLSPVRLVDTRVGSGLPYAGRVIGAGQTLSVQITGKGGIPQTDVSSVVVNVTAVSPTTDTYLTTYGNAPRPIGNYDPSAIRPKTSTIVAKAGQTVNSQTTTKLYEDGTMKIYNFSGNTNVIIDVVGYYSASGNRFFKSVVPTRIADTRAGSGLPYSGQTLVASGKLNINFRGIQNPNFGTTSTAVAAVVDVTVANPQASGFLSLYPAEASPPNASSLSYTTGHALTKEVTVKLGANGAFTILNSNGGSTEIIVDVVGYYYVANSEQLNSVEYYTAVFPKRITDTRTNSGLANAGNHIAPGGVLNVKAKFVADIPAGATGVVYGLTALNSTATTYMTTYPNGISRPNTSILNMAAGQQVSSQSTTKLGADGSFNIFNAFGTTDVLVDVLGYFYSNDHPLSYWTNACKPGNTINDVSGPTIINCLNTAYSGITSPYACPEFGSFHVTIAGQCVDQNGNPPYSEPPLPPNYKPVLPNENGYLPSTN